MKFRAAISKALPGADRPGLQALKRADRGRITCADTRTLAGSVDLDSALKEAQPNDSRWDYGVGLSRSAKADRIVWVEVHPASSTHVAETIKKLEWLKAWLARHPELRRMTAEKNGYRWVASGKVAIRPGTSQAALLARHGLSLPRAHLTL